MDANSPEQLRMVELRNIALRTATGGTIAFSFIASFMIAIKHNIK